jgi:hypothetical protein
MHRHNPHQDSLHGQLVFGASLTKIRFIGGWSKTTDVVTGKYLDPAARQHRQPGFLRMASHHIPGSIA